MKICPVILSGGSGTRLWPISRSSYPKQFINLISEESLFIETLNRISEIDSEILPPVIVCNEEHRFLVAQQLKESEFKDSTILLEPCSKNTAPATTLASLYIKNNYSDDVLMLVLPSDHSIPSIKSLNNTILKSKDDALSGALCIFGINPVNPHTGYGYIKVPKEKRKKLKELESVHVEAFIEKPNQKLAKTYLKDGNYLWNSGMFLFRVDSFLNVVKEAAPSIHEFCTVAMHKASVDKDFVRPNKEEFINCPEDSVDYAVMEKAINLGNSVRVTLLKGGWSDIGSLSSLLNVMPKDTEGNGVYGDVIALDTKNSLLYSTEGLLAVFGLEDILIVNTQDTVLVLPVKDSEKVKEIVSNLKANDREEADLHKEVHRPWGTYNSIYEKSDFKVKHIKVYPGAELSLQLHHKRAEHWVVVEGEATATCGDKTFIINKNESTFIPLGVKHKLANNTDKLLEMIEVQSGSYLGEDDIERFEDKYGRVN